MAFYITLDQITRPSACTLGCKQITASGTIDSRPNEDVSEVTVALSGAATACDISVTPIGAGYDGTWTWTGVANGPGHVYAETEDDSDGKDIPDAAPVLLGFDLIITGAYGFRLTGQVKREDYPYDLLCCKLVVFGGEEAFNGEYEYSIDQEGQFTMDIYYPSGGLDQLLAGIAYAVIKTPFGLESNQWEASYEAYGS